MHVRVCVLITVQLSFRKCKVSPTHYMMRTLDRNIPLTHWRLYGIVCSPPLASSSSSSSPALALSSSAANALSSSKTHLAPLERQLSVGKDVVDATLGLKRGDRVLLDSRGGDKGVKEDWITTPHTDCIFEIPVKHANVYYSGFEIELGEQNHSRTMAIYHLEFFGRYSTTRQSRSESTAERVFRQALQLQLSSSAKPTRHEALALKELQARLGISHQHAQFILVSMGLPATALQSLKVAEYDGPLGGTV